MYTILGEVAIIGSICLAPYWLILSSTYWLILSSAILVHSV